MLHSPEILNSYIEGSLLLDVKKEVETELRENLAGLKPEEAAVLTLLEGRLSRTLEDKLHDSVVALSKPAPGRKQASKREPRTAGAGVK